MLEDALIRPHLPPGSHIASITMTWHEDGRRFLGVDYIYLDQSCDERAEHQDILLTPEMLEVSKNIIMANPYYYPIEDPRPYITPPYYGAQVFRDAENRLRNATSILGGARSFAERLCFDCRTTQMDHYFTNVRGGYDLCGACFESRQARGLAKEVNDASPRECRHVPAHPLDRL